MEEGGGEKAGVGGGAGGRFPAGAAAIVALACFLRLHGLGGQEIWIDEAFSFYVATTGEMLRALLIEHTPPLYYLLLRGWVAVAGSSETALRLPSALAGTLYVGAVIWAGRELVGPAVGLWSGLMAAVAPIHIYYSQEVRAYALLTLALALTYAVLGRALRRDTWPWWMLGSASALLALSTHYFGLLGLLPTAAIVWSRPVRRPWGRYLVASLGSGLIFLPWVIWSFFLTPRSRPAIAWIRGVWERTPPWLAIPRSLEVFGLGSQGDLPLIYLKQFTTLAFPAGLRLLGLAVLLLLGLWVAGPWGDRSLGAPGLRSRKAALMILLGFPLAVLWLVSFVKPVYAVGRYDMVAFPAFSLLLGLALWKLQRIPRAGGLLACLAALLLLVPVGTKLFLYYRAPSQGDALATAQVLDAGVADGDVVVFTGLRGTPVLYYLSRLGYRWESRECRAEAPARRFSCRMYPRETERFPGVLNVSRVLASTEAVREDARDFLAGLRPREGSLWVAFERGTFSREEVALPTMDARLVQELQGLGLRFVAVQGARGILRFRRAE